MTRKDYIRIAAAINIARATRKVRTEDAIDVVVDVLCLALQSDNPRFDRARFIAATMEA